MVHLNYVLLTYCILTHLSEATVMPCQYQVFKVTIIVNDEFKPGWLN